MRVELFTILGTDTQSTLTSNCSEHWGYASEGERAELESLYPFLAQYATLWATGRKVHIHHLLPQTESLAGWFKSKGIDIHELKFLLPMFADDHLDIHGRGGGQAFQNSWNRRWEQFKLSNENASVGQIMQFLSHLRGQFGI